MPSPAAFPTKDRLVLTKAPGKDMASNMKKMAGKPVASNPVTNPGTIKGFNPQPEPPTKVRIGAQSQH